jgi:hypothetical protein
MVAVVLFAQFGR